MKNKKTLGALLLTSVMLLGISTSAFATENVPTIGTATEENSTTASITKNLEFAEGITIPSATFSFVATKNTPDAPRATISDISYTNSDGLGELKDGKYTLSKTSVISFEQFSHAGLYQYTVSEAEGSIENVSYSKDTYTLSVYVANKTGGGLYIKSITAKKDDNKKSNVLFTNTYTPNGSLTIEKKTTGELADKTKDFDFKITFTKSATSSETSYTGNIGEEIVTCTDGQETTFKLHDGESLVFENLPAGTRYKVEEVGETDGYTPSVQVIENGTETVTGKAVGEKDGITAVAENETTALVGEKTNKVTFINDYQDVALTGVIMNNLPFILLIGIGACALAVLAISKKRRALNS